MIFAFGRKTKNLHELHSFCFFFLALSCLQQNDYIAIVLDHSTLS